MKLNQIAGRPGSRHNSKRVGRGIGSGHGKTAGRGAKGQFASAGARLPGITFVGGQTPFFRRVPKRGFSNGTYAKHYNVVNLGDIDPLFKDGEEVNPDSLKAKGLAKKPADGVRILGDGELTKKLAFRAHGYSKSALAKIEANGGKAEVIPPPKKPVRNKMKPRPAKNA